MVNEISKISEAFKQKNYSSVITCFDALDVTKNIGNEQDAELFALMAFSLYHTQQYRRCLKYAIELVKHFEKNAQQSEAGQFYIDLLGIVIESFGETNQVFKAVIFAKRGDRKKRLLEDTFSKGLLEKYRTLIAERIVRVMNLFFPFLAVLLVVIRNSTNLPTNNFYFASMFVLTVILVFNWLGSVWLKRKIVEIL